MQTQKDRVNAYQFLIGRMSSALVVGDPSSAEPPDRRSWFGLLCGLALGVLVAVGFWVYGLIVPGGNTAWQQKGAILVEKESGTRYVYLDNQLHPVLNQASAMLVQGKDAHITMISRASLAGLSHGAPIGIPDAPDTLPTAGELVGGPWLLCLPAGDRTPATMSMVIAEQTTPRFVLPDTYTSVVSSTGVRYLVLGGFKDRIADASVPVALGLSAAAPPAAPDAWLDALPSGPDLAAADIAGAGKAGPPVAGQAHDVGQLFKQHNPNSADQLYVLRPDGLSPLSATEFALLAARSADAPPVEVTAADVVAAPHSADSSLLKRLPDVLQARPADLGLGVLCLRQQPEGVRVSTAVVIADSPSAGWPMANGAGAAMAPNTGMLVAAVPVPAGQKIPNRYLITDRGIKYPVPDNASLAALGYSGVPPVPVADEVLSALPTGPVLSQAALGVSEKG